MLLGINPLSTFFVCVPTRILAGWICGLVFKALSKVDKSRLWSFGAAGLCGAFNRLLDGGAALFTDKVIHIQSS